MYYCSISTMQSLTLQGAASTPGYTLGIAEERICMLWIAVQWGSSLSLWSWSLWEVGVRTSLTQSNLSVICKLNASVLYLWMQSATWPRFRSPFGEGMPTSGLLVNRRTQLGLCNQLYFALNNNCLFVSFFGSFWATCSFSYISVH